MLLLRFSILFIIVNPVFGWDYSLKLDTDSDATFGWKLGGSYTYLPKGDLLRELKMPEGFNFNSVSKAEGVWVILPPWKPNPKWANTVSFSYAASAQLLESITIVHNSGGSGTYINISTRSNNHTLTPRVMFEGWETTEIPLNPVNSFSVEVTAQNADDYVLIDKIVGHFVHTTTSTRRPTTTTHRVHPPSGSNRLMLPMTNLLYFIFIMTTLKNLL